MADITRALDKRLRLLAYEFAKFGVVGTAGVFITNAVYDLLNVHHHVGPVTSATLATLAAAVVTYLGNRYWSFRRRQRAGVPREVVIFAVLNGIGLLIQDVTVACNSYLLHLGHNRLAAFAALNLGIALATLFRFWSYRRFVWIAPPAPGTGAGRPGNRILQGLPAGHGSGGRSAPAQPGTMTPQPLAARAPAHGADGCGRVTVSGSMNSGRGDPSAPEGRSRTPGRRRLAGRTRAWPPCGVVRGLRVAGAPAQD